MKPTCDLQQTKRCAAPPSSVVPQQPALSQCSMQDRQCGSESQTNEPRQDILLGGLLIVESRGERTLQLGSVSRLCTDVSSVLTLWTGLHWSCGE